MLLPYTRSFHSCNISFLLSLHNSTNNDLSSRIYNKLFLFCYYRYILCPFSRNCCFPFLLYVSSVLFFNSSSNVVSSFSSHNSLIILSISSKTGSFLLLFCCIIQSLLFPTVCC